jgi:hypothetical protein
MSISVPSSTHSVQTLNQSGHTANGVLTGFTAAGIMQPAYTAQTYITMGKGLPPINALYRGFAANATCDVLGQGLTFLFYGGLKKVSPSQEGASSKIRNCVEGLRRGNHSCTCNCSLRARDDLAAA